MWLKGRIAQETAAQQKRTAHHKNKRTEGSIQPVAEPVSRECATVPSPERRRHQQAPIVPLPFFLPGPSGRIRADPGGSRRL